MEAYKCDRCGKFYTKQDIKSVYKWGPYLRLCTNDGEKNTEVDLCLKCNDMLSKFYFEKPKPTSCG